MKLECKEWRVFFLGDYFDVVLSSGDLQIDECEAGNIPLISSGATNNGVVGYIDKKGDGKARIFKANCITVDMFCNAFYQDKDFYAVSHGRVNVLLPKFKLNPQIALFLISLINKEQFKYSYGRAAYSSEVQRMAVKFPVDENGNPDWVYMENFIKSLNHKPITTQIRKMERTSYTLDFDKWKEYKVSDIFEIYNGSGITKEEIEENAGDFVAVQSGEEDNGRIGMINYDYCVSKGYTLSNTACLTVARSGSAGYVSYHPHGCVVGDSAKILKLKDESIDNVYTYLFLRTILMANKYKYTYGRKVTEDKYMDLKIMLPFNEKTSCPDWTFMKDFMKTLSYSDRI